MYLLKNLWDGNVHPGERAVRPDSEYKAIQKEIFNYLDQINEKLDPEGKLLLEKYYEKVLDAEDISNEEAFISGIRIGARFILDVLGEYHSQLPQVGEVE